MLRHKHVDCFFDKLLVKHGQNAVGEALARFPSFRRRFGF